MDFHEPTLANSSQLWHRVFGVGENHTTKIKRYSNRKLYDTVSSSYITLPEIGEMVKNGEEVYVECNKTGRDLTADTLTRLIFDKTMIGTPVKLDTLQRILCKGDGGLGTYFA